MEAKLDDRPRSETAPPAAARKDTIMTQLYDEDVEVGAELPSLTKEQSLKAIVMYAWGSNDLSDGHYDYKKAVDRGLPDVFGQGAQTAGYMGQMLSDWYTPGGFLRKLTAQYRQTTEPGDVLTTRGEVTRKYREDGQNFIDCNIWVENQNGQRVSVGQAIVSLPSRDG